MSDGILAVIPARLGSTRLPRKPLHLLAGRPLIEWVWRRAMEAGLFDRVIIATDSPEIMGVAKSFGAEARMTDPEHPSGTDRVAEVAALPENRAFPVVVNVQGDEPFIRAEQLRPAIELVQGEGWPIGTAATPLRSVAEWRDPAVVKVVRGDDGGALLFSRAPIPFQRDGEPAETDLVSGAFLRHLGIYVYAAEALSRWVALPEGRLERIERLEQLRPLAAGLRIGVAVVDPIEGGVDTPADAEAAERRLLTEAPALAGMPNQRDTTAR
jgi:3-deoxy-manno-octulosonate cytidylyltransferase (CMP-KDO synthetase)